MTEEGHCKNLILQLSCYVDGELDPSLCAELEQHLKECNNCRVVVDTMKRTIELYQDMEPQAELPQEVHDRLFKRLDLNDFVRRGGE